MCTLHNVSLLAHLAVSKQHSLQAKLLHAAGMLPSKKATVSPRARWRLLTLAP